MNAILRLLGWTLAVALVALPVVAVLNGWVGAEQWPLHTLRVQGQFQRVDARRVRETVLPHAREGFFAVDLDAAQAAVANVPWVARAQVRKRWPDVLEVRVVEHVPFARWGEDQLLSAQGKLFTIGDTPVPGSLPRLGGPAARVDDVVALYNQAQLLFADARLQVRGVQLDRRGSWSLTLDDGTRVLIGRHDARPRLARFARVLPRLLARHDQPLARADLRYTNGFALVWAKPGVGNGESGAGTAKAKATARFSTVGGMPAIALSIPRFPFLTPHSPFPIPGLQT